MRVHRRAVIFLLAGLGVATGCATRIPISETGASGHRVGVRVSTVSGEELAGSLVSLTDSEIVVDLEYREGARIEFEGAGADKEVRVDGRAVGGTIVKIERAGGVTVASVRRVVPVAELERVTFHRDGSRVRMGTILGGVLLGPAIGVLLALLI
jgi:hypothetical protein